MATDFELDEADRKQREAWAEAAKLWKALHKALKAFRAANRAYLELLER